MSVVVCRPGGRLPLANELILLVTCEILPLHPLATPLYTHTLLSNSR
jgi:hypothetical protein